MTIYKSSWIKRTADFKPLCLSGEVLKLACKLHVQFGEKEQAIFFLVYTSL